MSAQIDYTTVAVISMLSGFGGAIGTEIAKAIIGELRSRSKSIAHKPQKSEWGISQNGKAIASHMRVHDSSRRHLRHLGYKTVSHRCESIRRFCDSSVDRRRMRLCMARLERERTHRLFRTRSWRGVSMEKIRHMTKGVLTRYLRQHGKPVVCFHCGLLLEPGDEIHSSYRSPESRFYHMRCWKSLFF